MILNFLIVWSWANSVEDPDQTALRDRPKQTAQTKIKLSLGSALFDTFSASFACISLQKGYRKIPKFSDARKLCCNLPKIQTKRPNLRVFRQKDAPGTANSAIVLVLKEMSDLGLHCFPRHVCPKILNHYGSLEF